jgi:hypothetical protein
MASLKVVIHDCGAGFCFRIDQIKAGVNDGIVTPVGRVERVGDVLFLSPGHRNAPDASAVDLGVVNRLLIEGFESAKSTMAG